MQRCDASQPAAAAAAAMCVVQHICLVRRRREVRQRVECVCVCVCCVCVGVAGDRGMSDVRRVGWLVLLCVCVAFRCMAGECFCVLWLVIMVALGWVLAQTQSIPNTSNIKPHLSSSLSDKKKKHNAGLLRDEPPPVSSVSNHNLFSVIFPSPSAPRVRVHMPQKRRKSHTAAEACAMLCV